MSTTVLSLSKAYMGSSCCYVEPKKVLADDIHAIHACNGGISIHTKQGKTIGVDATHYPRDLKDILQDAARVLDQTQMDAIPVMIERHTHGHDRKGDPAVFKTRSKRTAFTCSQE